MADTPTATADATAQARARLMAVVEAIRAAPDPLAAMAKLDVDLVRSANGCRDVRRLLVSPFVREGVLPAAIAALQVLIDAYPRQPDERRLLASLLGRSGQWDAAIAHADAAAALEPATPALHAARIQLRLQAGQVAEAAAVARDSVGALQLDPGEAYFWVLAFLRNGDAAEAARAAALLDGGSLPNERVAAIGVRALYEDNQTHAAIQLGSAALEAGHDGASLRTYLGLAHLKRGTEADRKTHALKHFEAGLKLAPADIRLLSIYGETLLRAGRYRDAAPPLRQAVDLAPESEHTRVLYARALRYSAQYDEAADQFLKVLEQSPEKLLWQRAAVAALSQAGRKQEAEALFERYLAQRGDRLPGSFQEAMTALNDKLDTAPIPQARLDWAWSLRADRNADRAEWERAARWGHLVDHLLFDWLECREDQVEEAMTLLGELDSAERFFAPLLAAGRGVVVATAHVGPMYAGLMALELVGIPSRWLATAPSIARTSYAAALISTADQTEAQVAKSCMRALSSGYVLCLAIDGAANPAAPRTVFEGQEVTYSGFAAHMAHRMDLPSVFYAPRWENGSITFSLELLPRAKPGEAADAYAERWQQAYFKCLREHLAGPPENLRLSGGIWRHVKAPDQSLPASADINGDARP